MIDSLVRDMATSLAGGPGEFIITLGRARAKQSKMAP
jgi:hypothetical protein